MTGHFSLFQSHQPQHQPAAVGHVVPGAARTPSPTITHDIDMSRHATATPSIQEHPFWMDDPTADPRSTSRFCNSGLTVDDLVRGLRRYASPSLPNWKHRKNPTSINSISSASLNGRLCAYQSKKGSISYIRSTTQDDLF